ncbi:MAG: hypothetical protein ABIO79_06035 [Ferruginibacter sp.]
MNRTCILLTVLFFSFVSCKKDKTAVNNLPETSQEFTTCNCSIPQGKTAADEYISASINGIQLCADLKGSYQDPFENVFLYGLVKRSTGDTYYDNLHMVRYTKDGKFMFGIYMENTHLLTKQFPYELPRNNPEICEIGELQLLNQKQLTATMCQTCPTNNWHYNGSFFLNQLKFIGDKFENGFFEGRFEGVISTGSGRYAIVKDGKFKIRLTLIQRDIIIP